MISLFIAICYSSPSERPCYLPPILRSFVHIKYVLKKKRARARTHTHTHTSTSSTLKKNSPFWAIAFPGKFNQIWLFSLLWISQHKCYSKVVRACIRPPSWRPRGPPLTGWRSYNCRHRVQFSSPSTTLTWCTSTRTTRRGGNYYLFWMQMGGFPMAVVIQ
jgi:hypothetical protein